MLPDFPKVKERLYRMLLARYDAASERTLLSRLRAFVIEEGDRIDLIREDGSRETIRMRRMHAETMLQQDDVESMNVHALTDSFDNMSEQLLDQQRKLFFQRLDEACASVGNTVSAKGRGLTPDVFLEMIQRMVIDFTEKGEPEFPTLVMHPSQATAAKAMLDTLFASPEYQRQLETIVESKREEWRAREAHRQLVD